MLEMPPLDHIMRMQPSVIKIGTGLILQIDLKVTNRDCSPNVQQLLLLGAAPHHVDGLHAAALGQRYHHAPQHRSSRRLRVHTTQHQEWRVPPHTLSCIMQDRWAEKDQPQSTVA